MKMLLESLQAVLESQLCKASALPNATVNSEVLHLVESLTHHAATQGRDRNEVLTVAADRMRPLFLQSWLIRRAYEKPRGYPGDYLLLQGMYDERKADTPQGALLDRTFLAAPMAKAVQNRRKLLAETVIAFCKDRYDEKVRILSLGSGSGQELIDAVTSLNAAGYRQESEVLGFDFDPSALRYLKKRWPSGSSLIFTPVQSDIRTLSLEVSSIDFCYCAGVFDYLTDEAILRVLNEIWKALTPSSTFVFGNFVDRRPSVDLFTMDFLCNWLLIYRDEEHLNSLVEESPFRVAQRIFADPTGLNLFAVVEKR